MPVKFQVEADASKLVKAYELAAQAQDKVERGLEDIARAAEKSADRVQQAIRKEVQAYELVDEAAEKVERAVRTRAAQTKRRKVQIYGVEPLATRPPYQATHIPATTETYEMKLTPAEKAALRRERIGGQIAARRASGRYLAPALIRGVDPEDADAVAFARWQKSQELRAARARIRAAQAQEQAMLRRKAVMDRIRSGVTAVGTTITAGLHFVGRASAWGAEEGGRIGAENAAFERQMRELYAVGDNTRRMARLREQVLAGSTAYGIDRGAYADALTTLHSSVGNLPAGVGEQMMLSASQLTDVAGGQLRDNLMALIKVYQVYGDEAGRVDQIQSKLFKTVEEGIVTIEDVANLLPDVIPAARAFGVSMDEVAGALIVATQAGGRSEKTFTGFRNVILRMNQAEKEGIHLTGSLVDRLEQLSKVDPITLERIFGAQAISVISNLVSKVNELRSAIEGVRGVTGQEIAEKGMQAMADMPTLAAKTRQSIDQMIANAALRQGLDDPTMWRRDLETRLAEYGYERFTHPLAKRVAEETGQKWTNIQMDFEKLKGWGMDTFMAEMEKSGDPLKIAQARAVMLAIGGHEVYDPEGKRYWRLRNGELNVRFEEPYKGGPHTVMREREINRVEAAQKYLELAAEFPDLAPRHVADWAVMRAMGTGTSDQAVMWGLEADKNLAGAVRDAARRNVNRRASALGEAFDAATADGLQFNEIWTLGKLGAELMTAAERLSRASKEFDDASKRMRDIFVHN